LEVNKTTKRKSYIAIFGFEKENTRKAVNDNLTILSVDMYIMMKKLCYTDDSHLAITMQFFRRQINGLIVTSCDNLQN